MSNIILQTHQLKKHFGAVHAVEEVNLSVASRKIYGFLGPNGAGKTTTIGMILGLIHPTAGQIELWGEPLTPSHNRVLRRVGALVSGPALVPYLSARENLKLAARLHPGLPPKRIDAVLDPAGHLLVARLALAQPFEASQVPGLAQILPAALAGDTTPERLYARTVGGGLTFALPVVDDSGKFMGVLVLKVGLFNSPGWSDLLHLVIQTQQQLAAVDERNRLARALHDSVTQQVFAISMNLGAAQTLWERDSATARIRLDTAMTLARQAQQELAALIKTLRPAPLEGKALAPALGDWIQRWQAQTSLETRYQVTGQGELPEAVEQALFRVTQEALSNVGRHSGAGKVEVTLDL